MTGRTNYAFCYGDTVGGNWYDWSTNATRGMFQSRYQRGFRDAADGLSNTILMSEMGTNDGTPKVQGWVANDCPNQTLLVDPLLFELWFATAVLEYQRRQCMAWWLDGQTVVQASRLQYRSSTKQRELHSFRNAERLGVGIGVCIELSPRWRSHPDG